MKRSEFLQSLSLLSLFAFPSRLSVFGQWAEHLPNSPRMPLLFLGHGSPMNAIEENEFVAGFRKIALELPTPKAILCISAHWETNGTYVTSMQYPRTIHDFGGFPKKLYEVQYPAPGDPNLANEIMSSIKTTDILADHHWGLDHGAWSVIKHMYPMANIPVLQLSMDRRKDSNFHYTLGRSLSKLRDKGILIIGSGNIVHNLGLVAWNKLNESGFAFDWAAEARSTINSYLIEGNFSPLVDYKKLGKSIQLAIPSPDHFLPLLYCLGGKNQKDSLSLFNDKAVGGSLTMTSVKII
jgi:4,5-DOPA dioxygenase extradiol